MLCHIWLRSGCFAIYGYALDKWYFLLLLKFSAFLHLWKARLAVSQFSQSFLFPDGQMSSLAVSDHCPAIIISPEVWQQIAWSCFETWLRSFCFLKTLFFNIITLFTWYHLYMEDTVYLFCIKCESIIIIEVCLKGVIF